MLKRLFFVAIAVVCFSYWNARRSGKEFPIGAPSPQWTIRSVAGLKINLPCSLHPAAMKAKNTPPNIFSETYNGDSSGYHIGVGHYVFTDNRGSLMLESASKPLLATAKELNFQVRSINTATTLINGLRARRSDYTCVENQRPTQIMVVFLTRGSDAWLIEVHAASNDPKAEAFFLKIANSANAER